MFLFRVTVTILALLAQRPLPSVLSDADSPCPDSCGSISVNYPFGLRDGCGARQFRGILNCTSNALISTINNATGAAAQAQQQLFFQTPSGSYVVRSIDYRQGTLLIYDPLMSTCSGGGAAGPNAAPQLRRDFALSEGQYLTIVPSPDTFFALLNCSSDSPVLRRLSRVCTPTLSGHACGELYTCPSFQALGGGSGGGGGAPGNLTASGSIIFGNATSSIITSTSPPPPAAALGLGSGSGSGSGSPPCCFTRYDTLKYMTMEMLDCTHYALLYGMDKVRGIAPADWSYGIRLSFRLPDAGCDRCEASSGTCGFDVETGGALCICSSSLNSTTACDSGGDFSSDGRRFGAASLLQAFASALGAYFSTAFFILS